jgi:C4-dicarboxylate transporter DctM subunit
MSIVMICTMVLCFALTVSVAVSIGLSAVLGIQVSNANMLISVKEMFSVINKFPLAAIPFFILAGNLAAVSGSSAATTFAIGAILIPALIKHGYPTAYAAALQATSAELGEIIPPSIPMILYGVSAEVFIG